MLIFLFRVQFKLYIGLSDKFINSKKGLNYIKNNDNKCFLWCHIRHLNPLKIHLERITKVDRRMVNDLDYIDVTYPVSKKDCSKSEQKNTICMNVFCYEHGLVYRVRVSDKKFEDCMDLLLITDKNKLHYVYIKGFDRFMCNKKNKKKKNKKHFCRYCLQCFSSEKVLQEHKKKF